MLTYYYEFINMSVLVNGYMIDRQTDKQAKTKIGKYEQVLKIQCTNHQFCKCINI